MKEKSITVNDDPQFKKMCDSVTRCQLELLAVTDRHAQIEMEILGIKETPPSDDDQWSKFKSGSTINTRARSRIDALRAEQGDLQQREGFLTEALEQGRTELDTIRGRLSLEICKVHRAEFAKDARGILHALRQLCDIEQRSRARRDGLERDGVITGSIPHLLFEIGLWEDPSGSKVTGYRKWIAENYPEVS